PSEAAGHLLDALPAGSWIVLTEPYELREEGTQYLARLDDPRGLFSVAATFERCTKWPSVTVAGINADGFETSCHLPIEAIDRLTGPRSEVLHELAAAVDHNERVLLACHNQAEQQRLAELLAETAPTFAERVTLCVGHVSRGFRIVSERLVVLSDHELFGRTEVRRMPRRRRIETRALDSFLDLREGDLVVHLSHGIGRYRGMRRLQKDGRVEEHLVVEFRDNVQVYVPVSLIHLVQKYVGASRAAPELSKLGSSAWAKKKRRVAEAVSDLAAEMLQMQAAREARPGIAYPPDSHLQKEFDAAFPYTETDDQIQAIDAVKRDMERSRPMDRLLCGDVGFGKTEVAMRAAFKAIDA
ncbi:MAG TPA: transcription-repair coupling factor, partial [Planctomycetaceae bacterium]|nr:transcription-repair coupling factor [Planctomycetaceae bacterium]